MMKKNNGWLLQHKYFKFDLYEVQTFYLECEKDVRGILFMKKSIMQRDTSILFFRCTQMHLAIQWIQFYSSLLRVWLKVTSSRWGIVEWRLTYFERFIFCGCGWGLCEMLTNGSRK